MKINTDIAAGRAKLEREVRELEMRYEMTSEEMLENFRDTADMARWLLKLRALGRIK